MLLSAIRGNKKTLSTFKLFKLVEKLALIKLLLALGDKLMPHLSRNNVCPQVYVVQNAQNSDNTTIQKSTHYMYIICPCKKYTLDCFITYTIKNYNKHNFAIHNTKHMNSWSDQVKSAACKPSKRNATTAHTRAPTWAKP